MLHQDLWNQNSQLVSDCVHHPFVQGLGDGTLRKSAFRSYVAQDAFFLNSFAKAYAMSMRNQCSAGCFNVGSAVLMAMVKTINPKAQIPTVTFHSN